MNSYTKAINSIKKKNAEVQFYLSQNPKVKKIVSVLAVISISGAFFGIYLLVIRLLFDGGLNTFWPILSDEADYFITAKRIAEHGIINKGGYSGYYAGGEFSMAKSLNYGGHGFLPVFPYVLIFLIGGTEFPMAIISHLIIMTLTFIAVYFLTDDLKKTAAVQLASLSFLPFLLYFGSFMMEVQQFSTVVIIAVIYYKWINKISSRQCG